MFLSNKKRQNTLKKQCVFYNKSYVLILIHTFLLTVLNRLIFWKYLPAFLEDEWLIFS